MPENEASSWAGRLWTHGYPKQHGSAWLHAPNTLYTPLYFMERPAAFEALRSTGALAQAHEEAPLGLVALDDLHPRPPHTSSSVAAPDLQQPGFRRAGSDMSTNTHHLPVLGSWQGHSLQQLPDDHLLRAVLFGQAQLLHPLSQPQSAPLSLLDAVGLDTDAVILAGAAFSAGVGEVPAATDSPIISMEEAALERCCSSCRSLRREGEVLADSIMQPSGRADGNGLKKRAASFLLKAVRGCNKIASNSGSDSSGSGGEPGSPCLVADLEMLASRSIGRCWGLVQSKARGAESGRNGTPQAWNINWNTNSPYLLPEQTELVSFLASGSSSGENNSTAAPRSGCGQLYCVRSTDNKAGITAYAVACHGRVPAVTLSTAAGQPVVAGTGSNQQGVVNLTTHLWCNTMACCKKNNKLRGVDLALFRYCFVVVEQEEDSGAASQTDVDAQGF